MPKAPMEPTGRTTPKVSQATIDKIKSMGMDKALKSYSTGTAQFREGVHRMYGTKRITSAGKKVFSSGPSAAASSNAAKLKKAAGIKQAKQTGFNKPSGY
jgi:hypothetical protein